jgi:signal peptidase II
MTRRKLALVLAVLAGSVGLDQLTKAAAREYLQGRETLSYLGDTARLTYAENHGAFLGMGSTLPDSVRTLIFTGVVAIFLVGFLVWLLRASQISYRAVCASSLIVGGGIGNLIDRIVFDGAVTDFMNLGIGTLRTGIFNVADVALVAGVILFAFAPEMWSDSSADAGSNGRDDAAGEGGSPEPLRE